MHAPSIAATHGFFFCRAAMRSMPFCPMPATSSAAALLSSASSILMLAPAIHEPGLAEISTAPLIASSSSTRVMTCVHGARRGCKGACMPRLGTLGRRVCARAHLVELLDELHGERVLDLAGAVEPQHGDALLVYFDAQCSGLRPPPEAGAESPNAPQHGERRAGAGEAPPPWSNACAIRPSADYPPPHTLCFTVALLHGYECFSVVHAFCPPATSFYMPLLQRVRLARQVGRSMIEVGPTLHATNSEENAASPSSSDDTKLGPIGGELRVRNRAPLAPSHTH